MKSISQKSSCLLQNESVRSMELLLLSHFVLNTDYSGRITAKGKVLGLIKLLLNGYAGRVILFMIQNLRIIFLGMLKTQMLGLLRVWYGLFTRVGAKIYLKKRLRNIPHCNSLHIQELTVLW